MTLEEICSRIGNFIAAPDPNPSGFDDLARDLFAFQFEHNAAYRAYCQSRDVTPLNLVSPGQIPAIITSAFKEFDLSVLRPDLRATVFHSSGTTGQRPSRHFHSAETLRLYEQSLLAWFQPHLLPDLPRANFLILAPPPRKAPRSSLVHMFDAVSQTFGDSPPIFCARLAPDESWILDFEKTVNAVEELKSRALPVVICGAAFSFVHLCDFLAETEQTLAFPSGSRVLETGGYKGRSRSVPKSELHRIISQRLAIPATRLVSEYGMSELSSQAYDHPDHPARPSSAASGRVFHFPPWARVEIVSPEDGEPVADGETGLIRVFDLANVGSVMAVQTEDLARRRGAGFELLGRAALAEPRGCSLLHAGS